MKVFGSYGEGRYERFLMEKMVRIGKIGGNRLVGEPSKNKLFTLQSFISQPFIYTHITLKLFIEQYFLNKPYIFKQNTMKLLIFRLFIAKKLLLNIQKRLFLPKKATIFANINKKEGISPSNFVQIT